MARILLLNAQYPYPPRSGGALRTLGLLEGVLEAGHSVVLFCFGENPPPPNPLQDRLQEVICVPPPQRGIRQRLGDILLTAHADMARRFWTAEAEACLLARLAQGDIQLVHAESIEMTPYFPAIKRQFPDLPLIYGSLNAEADLQRSMFSTDRRQWLKPRGLAGAVYSWIQWRRLTRYERAISDLSAYVLAVSEPDQELLAHQTRTPVALVKNGITVADYLHLAPNQHLGEKALVFTGTMDYRPNIDAVLWFAEEIFPLVLAEHPTAHFYVVGRRPHARLAGLAAHPNLTLTGEVADMDSYWQGAAVIIAPLRMGSGTRFKLLSAMAAQCAIVSTTMGAQGLDISSGREMLIADSPTQFAQAVNQLLAHPDQRQALGVAGRRYVQANFDWSVIVPHLLAVYDELLAG